jgi:phosphohistidine phosphatase
MIRLYVLRHGIAVPHGEPGIDDDERPLTPKGKKRVAEVARALAAMDLALDRIVSSPLPRALQTARIVADVLELGDRLETADALRPDRDVNSMREWLLARHEASLMIVGHNPSLSELVGLLLAGRTGVVSVELRKGGIAALTATGGPGMRLDWLARPRLFRVGDDD